MKLFIKVKRLTVRAFGQRLVNTEPPLHSLSSGNCVLEWIAMEYELSSSLPSFHKMRRQQIQMSEPIWWQEHMWATLTPYGSFPTVVKSNTRQGIRILLHIITETNAEKRYLRAKSKIFNAGYFSGYYESLYLSVLLELPSRITKNWSVQAFYTSFTYQLRTR